MIQGRKCCMLGIGILAGLMLSVSHANTLLSTSASPASNQAKPTTHSASHPVDENGWIFSQQQPDHPLLRYGDASRLPARVPLGSLWKLWIYTYSLAQQLPDREYACHAGNQAQQGDEYCCNHDEMIGRDVALVRSCGAYFQPQRLHIKATDWQNYWQRQAPQATWLQHLDQIQPQTEVPVGDILNALNSVPPETMLRTRKTLLGRLTQPQWSGVLPMLGGAYRFKTFTWDNPQRKGGYLGGAAGWLADGTAFWLGGTGGSHAVVQRLSQPLATTLSPPLHSMADQGCVWVHYFKRYPITQITTLDAPHQGQRVTADHLRGHYRVQFANGQSLVLHAQGELSVTHDAANIQIYGHLPLADYLARVVDREGDARQIQAAQALAIAAHSYLRQNAEFHEGCWQIDDDSHRQRVSPNPPTAAAQAAVAFTEGLVLGGSPIFYYRGYTQNTTSKDAKDKTTILNPSKGLDWQAAVAQPQTNYITLLKQAYPDASWQTDSQTTQCRVLPAAEKYLQQHLTQATRWMANITGFEAPANVHVCALDYGSPYADNQALNIYLRDWRSQNDHITLWHEYLHLAMRFHPLGQNEQWIEQSARDLTNHLELSNTSSLPFTGKTFHEK